MNFKINHEGLITFGIPSDQWARVEIIHELDTTHGTTIGKGERVQVINVPTREIRTFIKEEGSHWSILLQTKSGKAYFANVEPKDIRLVDKSSP